MSTYRSWVKWSISAGATGLKVVTVPRRAWCRWTPEEWTVDQDHPAEGKLDAPPAIAPDVWAKFEPAPTDWERSLGVHAGCEIEPRFALDAGSPTVTAHRRLLRQGGERPVSYAQRTEFGGLPICPCSARRRRSRARLGCWFTRRVELGRTAAGRLREECSLRQTRSGSGQQVCVGITQDTGRLLTNMEIRLAPM